MTRLYIPSCWLPDLLAVSTWSRAWARDGKDHVQKLREANAVNPPQDGFAHIHYYLILTNRCSWMKLYSHALATCELFLGPGKLKNKTNDHPGFLVHVFTCSPATRLHFHTANMNNMDASWKAKGTNCHLDLTDMQERMSSYFTSSDPHHGMVFC